MGRNESNGDLSCPAGGPVATAPVAVGLVEHRYLRNNSGGLLGPLFLRNNKGEC